MQPRPNLTAQPLTVPRAPRIHRQLLLAASCTLATWAAGCGAPDLSSTPPAPYEEEGPQAQDVLDYDEQASRELAQWLRESCECDLAYRLPVAASNVRGDNAFFTPSALTDEDPATYWTTDETVTTASATIEFGETLEFDHVVLQEHVELGRRVEGWTLSVRTGDAWQEVARGKTIGAERALAFERVSGEALRLSIDAADACPVIDTIEIYSSPKG